MTANPRGENQSTGFYGNHRATANPVGTSLNSPRIQGATPIVTLGILGEFRYGRVV
jgi:hypothetical protein